MTPISTWGVKVWTGQSTRTWAGLCALTEVVPLLGLWSPWVPLGRTRLCGCSFSLGVKQSWKIPQEPLSSWPAMGFAARGLKCQNPSWMRNLFQNNSTKDCEDIQTVEKCLQLFLGLLLINAARGNME